MEDDCSSSFLARQLSLVGRWRSRSLVRKLENEVWTSFGSSKRLDQGWKLEEVWNRFESSTKLDQGCKLEEGAVWNRFGSSKRFGPGSEARERGLHQVRKLEEVGPGGWSLDKEVWNKFELEEKIGQAREGGLEQVPKVEERGFRTGSEARGGFDRIRKVVERDEVWTTGSVAAEDQPCKRLVDCGPDPALGGMAGEPGCQTRGGLDRRIGSGYQNPTDGTHAGVNFGGGKIEVKMKERLGFLIVRTLEIDGTDVRTLEIDGTDVRTLEIDDTDAED
ncbi:hypothetical protein CBR_g49917 [Chara braunii]|uniref:Uncharacterized protein n=1 Tax=Chara braunii TaxID=69332 RepID=A0A388JPF4_CHABU|nr:hypothetical protein CBR_g49917 [Chara braunii]|eukprot:GBG59653.1 hypothetical protein CBR_g49917 [Chara braunii]